MKIFLDTEFIEDGKTIDLISIGMVNEAGHELYLQNIECEFHRANDWVWDNVFPNLKHFKMRGKRGCVPEVYKSTNAHQGHEKSYCKEKDCPWRTRAEIARKVFDFCCREEYGKLVVYNTLEFWGYYADYDWVAFCQLFGKMINLPKGFPMYCNDIKQLAMDMGNPELPKQQSGEHNALSDAWWNKQTYEFLCKLDDLNR
jgi:hypothetical protein